MVTLLLLLMLTSSQTPAVADVDLTIGFREQVEGRSLQQPIYVLDVACREAACSYTYVSLNDCGPARRAFSPKVHTASTRNGDLTATSADEVLTLEQRGEDSYGEWVNTFRIGYEPTRDGSPATRVVGFTGTFVKTSELIAVPTRIQYIAIEGPFQEIALECPLLVPGVGR
jgi:hypothetical protein